MVSAVPDPSMKEAILASLSGLTPADSEEREYLQDIRDWLNATPDIYRRAKPATPAKHLAVYCVPLDIDAGKAFLGYHLAANLWLPPGGHVETNEHPVDAAIREYTEELGVAPVLLSSNPLLATVEPTNGPGGHIDVTFWYAFRSSTEQRVCVDEREFKQTRWVEFDEVRSYATNRNLPRFLSKVRALRREERVQDASGLE
jgi:8-oxo-dGTP pyrophosphatase MutT (NUDIX family)